MLNATFKKSQVEFSCKPQMTASRQASCSCQRCKGVEDSSCFTRWRQALENVDLYDPLLREIINHFYFF